MHWTALIIAGVCETVWAVGLKYVNGTKNMPMLITVGSAMVLSIWGLYYALRAIPMGTAYAVWTGIGIIGTVTFGIIVLHEPAHGLRLLFLGMILVGIIGLKLS